MEIIGIGIPITPPTQRSIGLQCYQGIGKMLFLSMRNEHNAEADFIE